MLDFRKGITVPPRWKEFSLMLISFFVFLFIFANCKFETSNPIYYVFSVYQIILGVGVFVTGVHYSMRKDCIIVKFIGIPLRCIRWERIGHAAYLHAWKDVKFYFARHERGPVYGQIIYVTFGECPRYNPKYQTRWLHNITHPFRVACIWLPDSRKYQYIDAFKECYPELEIQPLDAWKSM